MCSAESTPDPNNGGSITKTPDATSRNPNRRSNKPIMEKRRRARINNCLNELKGILLEAMRKDPARHSKLEKADILELTVSHLKALHRHHSSGSNSGDGSRFRAGFAECAAEVGRFLSSTKPEGIDPQTSGRLLSHLADCINNPSLGSPPMNNNHPTHTPLSSLEGGGNVTTTLNVGPNTPIISLVPSRLSSGEIAFVVPGFNSSAAAAAAAAAAQHQHQHHLRGASTPSSAISLTMQSALHCNPPPMLSPEVPLELTVSSSSSSGCSLSPNYPIGNGHSHLHQHHHHHHHQQHQQQQQQQQQQTHPHPPTFHPHKLGSYSPALPPSTQPLALVTPKKEEQDGNCWRPWW
ncbi:unnamed protein product [Allacma fusca]|uniref:Uncharacterized protein n=1 Tax=Allacma fusca TaxID=39272 RepID=A0A8J2NLE5_9HEXA|nr:unnamed protein product [Allacma fusca]